MLIAAERDLDQVAQIMNRSGRGEPRQVARPARHAGAAVLGVEKLKERHDILLESWIRGRMAGAAPSHPPVGQAAAATGASTGWTARRLICTRFQRLIAPISSVR